MNFDKFPLDPPLRAFSVPTTSTERSHCSATVVALLKSAMLVCRAPSKISNTPLRPGLRCRPPRTPKRRRWQTATYRYVRHIYIWPGLTRAYSIKRICVIPFNPQSIRMDRCNRALSSRGPSPRASSTILKPYLEPSYETGGTCISPLCRLLSRLLNI